MNAINYDITIREGLEVLRNEDSIDRRRGCLWAIKNVGGLDDHRLVQYYNNELVDLRRGKTTAARILIGIKREICSSEFFNRRTFDLVANEIINDSGYAHVGNMATIYAVRREWWHVAD
jgi:hypothetical protein